MSLPAVPFRPTTCSNLLVHAHDAPLPSAASQQLDLDPRPSGGACRQKTRGDDHGLDAGYEDETSVSYRAREERRRRRMTHP